MTSNNQTNWRDVIKVHPAAELFLIMSTAELRELGEDIQKNGLTSPIIMWGNDDAYLLDGRNRLDAMQLVGVPVIAPDGHFDDAIPLRRIDGNPLPDPYDYVISANIHRRHLSLAERRELIAKCLERNPERSDRQHAEILRTDHKTVGAVRKRLTEAGRIEPTTETVGTDGRARRTATEKQISRAVDASREAARRQFDAAAAKLGVAGERDHKDARIAELESEIRELRARIERAETYDQKHCSFCGKAGASVQLLVVSDNAGICSECLDMAVERLAERRAEKVDAEAARQHLRQVFGYDAETASTTEPEPATTNPRPPRTKALDDPTRPRNRLTEAEKAERHRIANREYAARKYQEKKAAKAAAIARAGAA